MQITLSFKAEAANKLEMIPYTGNNGLYVSMVPRDDMLDDVMKLAEELGITPVREALHTTVIYSKKPAGELPIPDPERQVTAVITSVDSWVGHNNKTYIVLKLASEALLFMHGDYSRRGAEATFIPYAPHITLSDDVEVDAEMKVRMEKLNKYLNYDPKLIYLTNERIGDLD